MEPVPAATQKQALDLLRKDVFAPGAFAFSPQLLNKLVTERHSDYFRPNAQRRGSTFNLPVHSIILSLLSAVLTRLLHPVVLSRILDFEGNGNTNAFRLVDLFQGLQDSIWAEVQGPGAVSMDRYRRSLQREHLKRMTNLLLRDAAAPEDARTLARYELVELQGRIKKQMLGRKKPALPLETRAHLAECSARIRNRFVRRWHERVDL